MSSDLSMFYTSVKNVRAELQMFAKVEGASHSLDPALFQKFLYNSINYVSTQSSSNVDGGLSVELADWFSDLSQVFHLLFQHRSDWDSRYLSPKNIISYFSNISYKLLSLQQVPLEWHRSIWVAVLRVMAFCSHLSSPGPEFITSVAQMGYKILRSAGQKEEAKHKLDKSVNVDLCYELYFLGAVIVSLDPTGRSGDGLKLTKDFLAIYLRFYKSRVHKADQASALSAKCDRRPCATRLLNMAVVVYTSRPRDVAAEASLTIYVELFRFVLEDPVLCEKLLACAGDLFKYVPSENTDDLPADVIQAVRENCSMASTGDNKLNTSSVQGIVLAVLTFVHKMRRFCSDHEEVLSLEKGFQSGLVKDIQLTMNSISNMLESPGSISAAVNECLVVYTLSLPRPKQARGELLAACIKMNSVSVDVFVRDILLWVFKQSQAELVCQRLHTLGLVTTANMKLLESHLTMDKLDDERVKELAETVKSTLKSLHSLAEAASKKKDMYPDLCEHSFTILRRAMSDVGTLGRKLTRLGLYSLTISLLAPLWPVTRMEELLVTVSHHEALCESYWKTQQLKEAWAVISKAVIIDASLLSEGIINILVKMLKQETSLSVLKLLEPCQNLNKHADLLVTLVRKLARSQSLPALRNASIILRCLVQHSALSDTQRASHQFLLAQTLWLEAEDKVSVSRECQLLLVKTVRSLLADTSHLFDDVLVQATFLYWAVLGTASLHDTTAQSLQVDTEFLMVKASACLMVWTEWFSSVGDKLLDTDDMLRLETSLRFLQRVAELAIINYKAVTAVTALCQAHHLANLMKRPDVVEDILRTLISVIPLMGLQWAPAMGPSDDLSNEEFLIKTLNPDHSGDLMCVTAAAVYHLRTGKLDKYVHARSVAGGIIDGLKKQGLRTSSIYTGLAILSRLDAEFYSLPCSSRPAVADGPTPYPLELVGDSLKYIKNVLTYHLGENSTSKSPPVDVWPVIHEYLTSLRLYGDLYLHVGNAKYAKIYFTEGLVMSRKFLLVVWSAVFSACLLKAALVCQDTTSEAEELLQSTMNLLMEHCLAEDKTDVEILTDKKLIDAVTSQQISCLFASRARATSKPPCSCCLAMDCEDAVSVRERLLTINSVSMEQEKVDIGENDHEWKVLSPSGTCDRCFQPEIADLCAVLMCCQAEILWRNKEPQWAVSSSLQAAFDSAQCLAQMCPKECVQDILRESGLNLGQLQHGDNVNCSSMLSTVYQLAEMTFQSLYMRDLEKPDSYGYNQAAILTVHRLLDIVEREGKKMKGSVVSNVVVASALLLKSHLCYLPLLQMVEEAVDQVTSDRAVIVMAVETANKEKQCLDQHRRSLVDSSHIASNSSSLTNMYTNCQHTAAKQARVVLKDRSLQQYACNKDNIEAEFLCTGGTSSKCKRTRLARCASDKTKLRKLNLAFNLEKKVAHPLSEQDLPGRYARYCKATSQSKEHDVSCDSQTHWSSLPSPLLVLHENRKLFNEQKQQKYDNSHTGAGQIATGCRVGECREESPVITEMSKTIQESSHDKGSTANPADVIVVKEYGKTTLVVRGRVRQRRRNEKLDDDMIPPAMSTKTRRKVTIFTAAVEAAETVRGADSRLDLSCVSSDNMFLEQISDGSSGDLWGCCSRDETAAGECMFEDLSVLAGHCAIDADMSNHSDLGHLEANNQIRADPYTPEKQAVGWELSLQSSAEIPRGRPQKKKTGTQVQGTRESEAGRAIRGLPRRKVVDRSRVDNNGSEFRVRVDEEKENLAQEIDDDSETLSMTVLEHMIKKDNSLQPSTPVPGKLQELFSPNIANMPDTLVATTKQRASRTAAEKLAVQVRGAGGGGMCTSSSEEPASQGRLDATVTDRDERTATIRQRASRRRAGKTTKEGGGGLWSRPQEPTLQQPQKPASQVRFDATVTDRDERTATIRQRASRRRAGKQAVPAEEGGGGLWSQPQEPTLQGRFDVTSKNRDERNVRDVDLQDLITKFPTLNFFKTVTDRIKYLQDGLQQLDQFAPSVLHRQISQSMALCLWEKYMAGGNDNPPCSSSQLEIAAYLTDSMHATFQHQMAKNLHYKLRKARGKNDSTSNHIYPDTADTTRDAEAMMTALTSLSFGGNVMKRFNDRISSLPADWTVGHVAIVDLDPSNPGQGQVFVTRLTSGSEPLTVGLPCDRWPALQRSLRLYELAIEHKTDHSNLKEHWKHRHQQDQDMQKLVHYLQDLFLGAHKWLLRGQMAYVKELTIQQLLDQAAQDTVLQLDGYHVSYGSVRNLLEVLLEAPEKDIISLLESVWPTEVAHMVAGAIMGVQQAMMAVSHDKLRGPVILILDKTLNKIPWESMPDLSHDTVTRLPSLASLHVMLTLQNKRPNSPFLSGVVRNSAVAVIPPDTDLQNAVSHLAPQFQRYPGWKCLIQKAPTVSELESFLTDSSLYLYCGHNWGHQYVGGRDVQLFHGRAVAILMGCGSARLEHGKKVDGDGGPLYFLLAGCPAVVGNLWLVTDKDIDKLTSCLFSDWMAQNNPISLGQLLSGARKVCKLVGLTGFAPVIYGLPVMMN